MSENHHLEKHETTPQSNVDFESILERGEIESARGLEGYWGIQIVEIKDDGDALFRPDDVTDIFEEEIEAKRSDLELMAYGIDQILGFGLVPTVTRRIVKNTEGSLQRRIKSFYAVFGIQLDYVLDNKVKPEEITRAAIFDYLLDVKDRHDGNFIIDSDTDKLWLIDHDFHMFFDTIIISNLIKKARERGLVALGSLERASLERFLAHTDSLMVDAKPEVIEIIKKARDRAEILLEKGQIPATNA